MCSSYNITTQASQRTIISAGYAHLSRDFHCPDSSRTLVASSLVEGLVPRLSSLIPSSHSLRHKVLHCLQWHFLHNLKELLLQLVCPPPTSSGRVGFQCPPQRQGHHYSINHAHSKCTLAICVTIKILDWRHKDGVDQLLCGQAAVAGLPLSQNIVEVAGMQGHLLSDQLRTTSGLWVYLVGRGQTRLLCWLRQTVAKQVKVYARSANLWWYSGLFMVLKGGWGSRS